MLATCERFVKCKVFQLVFIRTRCVCVYHKCPANIPCQQHSLFVNFVRCLPHASPTYLDWMDLKNFVKLFSWKNRTSCCGARKVWIKWKKCGNRMTNLCLSPDVCRFPCRVSPGRLGTDDGAALPKRRLGTVFVSRLHLLNVQREITPRVVQRTPLVFYKLLFALLKNPRSKLRFWPQNAFVLVVYSVINKRKRN